MSILDTLDQIEGMVAGARTLPFTGKIVIDDKALLRYVEELRKELPSELKSADEIMENEEAILQRARTQAEHVINEATEFAARLTEENSIVKEAREKAKTVLEQTQQKEREILERTKANAEKLQSDADIYAAQVFDQLIRHVSGTFQGVQQAEGGLKQALNVLQQAQKQLSRPRPPVMQQQSQAQPQQEQRQAEKNEA